MADVAKGRSRCWTRLVLWEELKIGVATFKQIINVVPQKRREACEGQGLKTENKVGALGAEYEDQLTSDGSNFNVLMQQIWPQVQWM